jgi:pentatricopeptide repeat protein
MVASVPSLANMKKPEVPNLVSQDDVMKCCKDMQIFASMILTGDFLKARSVFKQMHDRYNDTL